MARKHRARTAEQILEAAMQTGEQYPCGYLTQLYEAQELERARAHRKRLTDAYTQGACDATDRAGLYDLATIRAEHRNTIAAYERCDPIEPAISYLVGYAGALTNARILAEQNIRTR